MLHGRERSIHRIAKTAAASLTHGYAIPWAQHQPPFGIDLFVVLKILPQMAIMPTHESAGRKLGALSHQREIEYVSGVIAEHDLLTRTAAKGTRATGIGEDLTVLDRHAGEVLPDLCRDHGHIGRRRRHGTAVDPLQGAEAASEEE